MRLLEAFRIALRMIRANVMKAVFTVLGTVVGVTFLIAVFTIIEGMNSFVEDELGGAIYGINTVQLRRYPAVMINVTKAELRRLQRRPRIEVDDAVWLEERMETPGVLTYSASEQMAVRAPGGRDVENVIVTGAAPSYFVVNDLPLAQGRTFTPREAEDGVPVVVIGKDVADQAFEESDPIGQSIRIGGIPFRVVGVLEEQGSLFGQSRDKVAIAPLRGHLDGVVNDGFAGTVSEVTYKVPDSGLIAAAQAEMEGAMRVRRRLRPGTESDFAVDTAEDSLAFWDKIRGVLLVAGPGLILISLVVGAVVIMNIMLVSVAERTREVGLRKSLGAKRRDVLYQFLCEVGTLSVIGGLIGIVLGLGLAFLVEQISPMPASVAWEWMVIAVLVSVTIGLVAGVYPAWRASRLDPIVALRSE